MKLMVHDEPARLGAAPREAQADAFELNAAEWSALQAGDNTVRKRVFLRYAAVIQRAIRGWVRGIRPEDCDDLVSEAFFRAFKNIAAVKAAQSFEGWLLSLARNTAMDFCRRQGRAMKLLALEDLSAPAREQALQATRSDDAAGILAQLAAAEDRETLGALIAQVLAELPARQQQALLDRYRDGKTLSAIASALRIDEAAAGSLLYRARLAFREKFLQRRGSAGHEVKS